MHRHSIPEFAIEYGFEEGYRDVGGFSVIGLLELTRHWQQYREWRC